MLLTCKRHPGRGAEASCRRVPGPVQAVGARWLEFVSLGPLGPPKVDQWTLLCVCVSVCLDVCQCVCVC